jgi:predicted nuclease with TOPRIM domain
LQLKFIEFFFSELQEQNEQLNSEKNVLNEKLAILEEEKHQLVEGIF